MIKKEQSGYMDMQIMPVMIGVILLIMVLGLLDNPAFDPVLTPVKFYCFLLLAITVLLYGFGMHIYALGYPESPFNKHSSPILMTLLCAAPMGYGAYRLFNAGMLIGSLLLALLTLLVCATELGFTLYRKRVKKIGE